MSSCRNSEASGKEIDLLVEYPGLQQEPSILDSSQAPALSYHFRCYSSEIVAKYFTSQNLEFVVEGGNGLIMQSLLGEAALSYPQVHSHRSKPAYYSFMRREIMHSKHASGLCSTDCA